MTYLAPRSMSSATSSGRTVAYSSCFGQYQTPGYSPTGFMRCLSRGCVRPISQSGFGIVVASLIRRWVSSPNQNQVILPKSMPPFTGGHHVTAHIEPDADARENGTGERQ